MMQPELIMDLEMNTILFDLEFPSPLSTFNFPSPFFSNDFTEFQWCNKELLFELPQGEFQLDMFELEQYVCHQADDGMSTDHSVPCSVLSSSQILMTDASPVQEDNELSLFHLLKAYGEATEREQTTLMEVIQRCISDKASPIGDTMQRLAFNLFKTNEQHYYSYIKQESQVNLKVAKKALYTLFPYGRFAHLSANSAILEAIPEDTKNVNIVDFDIHDGVQWASVIETLSHQKKELTLTLVKWPLDDISQCNPDNTRKILISHARSVGMKLNVLEVDIEDLVSEMKRSTNKRCVETQWFAFNCMTSLPHMIKSRSKSKVHEFLTRAKDVIGNGGSRGRGIITYGNGDADVIKSTSLSSFFERQVVHHQALMKSVECTLSDQFTEAKVAIECLFMSSRICSHEWVQKWENMNEGGNVEAALALEGLQLSQNTLMEANELVRLWENSYELTMGHDVNEMVLQWRGTPLVKLSTWR